MKRFTLWVPTILLIATLSACQHAKPAAPPPASALQALPTTTTAPLTAPAITMAIAMVRPSAAATTRPDNNDVTGTVISHGLSMAAYRSWPTFLG